MLKKNTEEINEKVKKIEKETTLNEDIIRIIAKQDIKEYSRDILEARINESLGNFNISNLDEDAFCEKLIESYKHTLPFGYCHIYWGIKKDILKEKYNIEWYTPDEENPETIFD